MGASSVSSYLERQQGILGSFNSLFFGFLRASEYTAPTSFKYSPSIHLTTSDVIITNSSLQLRMKRSKMDRYHKSVTIIIGPTNDSICHLKAMQRFLATRQKELYGFIMTLSSGEYMTCRDASSLTQQLLHSTNLEWVCYSSHSYRIGAATMAAAAGLPDHLIKTLGCWRSSAYQGNIHTSPEILRQAASQLSHAA